ncbi:MAG TPA: hypothetical protein PKV73_15905 [Agriterribacter sp.]|nr:hypothetical protein [Agriterribacter sp.]
MKKLLFLLFVTATISISLNAQDGSSYTKGIGLRVGGGYYDLVSASFKAFVTEPGAIEVNIGFRPYGYVGYSWVNLSGSVSYQHHFPIGSVEGLRWFVGGGVTAYNTFSSDDYYRGFGLGVFPTGGVDYKFGNIPLNVSADFRPTIALIKPYEYYSSFYAGNAGVSARYTF